MYLHHKSEPGKWTSAITALFIMVFFFGLIFFSDFFKSFSPAQAATIRTVITLVPVPEIKAKTTAKPKQKPKLEKRKEKTADKPDADVARKKKEEEEKKRKKKAAAEKKRKKKEAEKKRKEKEDKEAERKEKKRVEVEKKRKEKEKLEEAKEKEKKKKEEEEKRKKDELHKQEEQRLEEERKKDQERKQEKQRLEEERIAAEDAAALAKAKNDALQSRLTKIGSKFAGIVRQRVERHLQTPLSTPKRSTIGVKINFRLTPKGELSAVPTIIISSGYKDFDEEAIRAILQAAPIPIDSFLLKNPQYLQDYLDNNLWICPVDCDPSIQR